MKYIALLVTTLAAFVSVGGAASASTILEEFNKPPFSNGNQGDIISQGITYSPADTVSGQCFNSLCLTESSQSAGAISMITYDASQAALAPGEGTPNTDAKDIFQLLGLYVNFNGLTANKAAQVSNFLTIAGNNNSSVTIDVTTGVGSIAGLSAVYSVNKKGNVLSVGDALSATDTIPFDSNGVFLQFDDRFFGASKYTLTSDAQGTVRLDCMYYSTGDSKYSGDFGELKECSPNVPPVPLPAAGWLLLAGIGGLAAYGRKKRAA